MTTREMTVTEHNEQLTLEKRILQQRLSTMQVILAQVCSVYADDKDKLRIPKVEVDRADDVIDVNWKTLKAGSLVVSVVRSDNGVG